MNEFEKYPALAEFMQEYASFGHFSDWQRFTEAVNGALQQKSAPDAPDLSKIKDAVTRAINELPEGDDYDPGQVVMDARDSLYKILSLTKKVATHAPDAKPLIEALENLNNVLDGFFNTPRCTTMPMPDRYVKQINAAQQKAGEALKNYNP